MKTGRKYHIEGYFQKSKKNDTRYNDEVSFNWNTRLIKILISQGRVKVTEPHFFLPKLLTPLDNAMFMM